MMLVCLQETYLPYMMRAKLKLLMEGGQDESLLGFVDASMQNQRNRDILEVRGAIRPSAPTKITSE